MSETNETEGKPVEGLVKTFYQNAGEDSPPAFYVKNSRYSVMTAEDAEKIEEGYEIRFRFNRKGNYRNVVPGSVEVTNTDVAVSNGKDTEAGGDGSTAENPEVFESPRDRSIRQNVALKQARELCQPLMHEDVTEDRVDEIREKVTETAEVFADKLREMNRQAAGASQ
jgi:hypothetical protein